MLLALGVPLRTVGTVIELDPAGWSGQLPAFDITLPGDVSAAAFLLVAALVVPGSRVAVRSVGTNPTRTGILDILRDMGAPLAVEPLGDEGGEPIANIHVECHGVSRGPNRRRRVGDARDRRDPRALRPRRARAGTTTVRDAAELRVKESDRIATMVTVLRAFGVTCEQLPDGMRVEGTDKTAPRRRPWSLAAITASR